jgi:glycosyltransferase involved in cell wall biosynthesis
MKQPVNRLLRVLVVCPRLDIGGTEMHLARVVPKLRRRGLDISIFVLERGGELEDRLVREGVPVSGPARQTGGLLQKARIVVLLRRKLLRLQPDIIHCFLPEPYFIGSVASAGIGDLIRIMSRRSLSVYQKNHPILARLEKWLHRFTKVLLGNSAAVVEELVAECNDRSKVELIYNGIDIASAVSPEQRIELRQELGIPTDAFVLVVCANFISYKGHSDLFDAIGTIKATLTGSWRLLLIGHDFGIGAALRLRAASLGIANNIVWVEGCSDAQTLLAAADIAVVPSHQEGFSNSLIEAMAHGLPVVATQVGGNIDAIVDSESGLLVAAQDRSAMASAISRLYRDVVLRQRLGAAARARANKNFSLDRCVQNYLSLYKRVTGENPKLQHIASDAVLPVP